MYKQEIELSRKLHRVQELEQGFGQDPETVLIQEIALENNLPSALELKQEKQNELFLFLARKLFPEDCIAELVALYKQLKSQNKSIRVISITLLWNVLELLWAFYIQTQIENIWLSQTKVDE